MTQLFSDATSLFDAEFGSFQKIAFDEGYPIANYVDLDGSRSYITLRDDDRSGFVTIELRKITLDLDPSDYCNWLEHQDIRAYYHTVLFANLIIRDLNLPENSVNVTGAIGFDQLQVFEIPRTDQSVKELIGLVRSILDEAKSNA